MTGSGLLTTSIGSLQCRVCSCLGNKGEAEQDVVMLVSLRYFSCLTVRCQGLPWSMQQSIHLHRNAWFIRMPMQEWTDGQWLSQYNL